MLKFFSKFFDVSQKKTDQYQKIVDQINDLEEQTKKLSDKQLAGQTEKFKSTIKEALNSVDSNNSQELQAAQQAVLTEILPEAFATVRETSRRVLGMRHFDSQLLAGVALHYSNITEQKTGEGKTLTVTAPLYLNALLGQGSHLITVNDYLAEVGVGWMGPIYHFLGLSVSVIVHDHSRLYNPDIDSESRGDERLEHFEEITRQQAYLTDITYGTNNEFGFDYLRDNMVQSLSQMAQRSDHPHYFTIVDEADSILIDEARTPLIISAPDTEPTKKYFEYAHMVNSLVQDQDFSIDEKAKSVTLTDLGVKRIEQKLGVKNLYEESFDTIHHVESALKAKTIYQRDKEYIVRDNQVVIVDEHTGRLMFGRRYSDGLHQAIEAKENVPIQQESRTLATISIQNYFRMYQKLSGMTGTAVTEAEEFNKIYGVDVLAIPTNKPLIREDKTDVIYKTTAGKYSAIVKEVEKIHKLGRPILIGTKSIEHNQIIANFLKRKNIPLQVLNAKNHLKEAFIIADAGRTGAITVATNIAGRGVDIILGGSKPELKDFRKKILTKKKTKLPKEFQDLTIPVSVNPANYKLKEYASALKKWQQDHDKVVEAGGLHILGTERHESRRIDNQLRGRAGRQGDPGSSQFFVALDDEIMRIFGGDTIAKAMDFLKLEEDQPIEHPMISKSIESAQVKVEGFFFDQRKRLVDFDDVMNKHREIVYTRRRRLLDESEDSKQSLTERILGYVDDEISALVATSAPVEFSDSEMDRIVKEFIKIIPFDEDSQAKLRQSLKTVKSTQEIESTLQKVAKSTYSSKEKLLGSEMMRQLEKLVSISTVDEHWMNHLDELESLRQGIWLRGDKQTVLSEYKKEAFAMFEGLINKVESAVANRIFRAHPVSQPPQEVVPSNAQMHKDDIHESLSKEVQDASVPTPDASPKFNSGSVSDLASVLGKARAGSKPQPGSKQAKIGRNDSCPCGSGLKYKKCGLINGPQHKT